MKGFLSGWLIVVFVLILGSTQASFPAVKAPAKKSAKKSVEKKTIPPILAVPVSPKPLPLKNGWLLRSGYCGGAGKIELGYERVLNEKINLIFAGGYGLGNSYTFFSVGATLLYKLRNEIDSPFVGLEADYSSFSKYAINVPLVGTINKDGGVGLGVLAGLTRANLLFLIGYNSRTGILAELGYRLGR